MSIGSVPSLMSRSSSSASSAYPVGLFDELDTDPDEDLPRTYGCTMSRLASWESEPNDDDDDDLSTTPLAPFIDGSLCGTKAKDDAMSLVSCTHTPAGSPVHVSSNTRRFHGMPKREYHLPIPRSEHPRSVDTNPVEPLDAYTHSNLYSVCDLLYHPLSFLEPVAALT